MEEATPHKPTRSTAGRDRSLRLWSQPGARARGSFGHRHLWGKAEKRLSSGVVLIPAVCSSVEQGATFMRSDGMVITMPPGLEIPARKGIFCLGSSWGNSDSLGWKLWGSPHIEALPTTVPGTEMQLSY